MKICNTGEIQLLLTESSLSSMKEILKLRYAESEVGKFLKIKPFGGGS